MKLVAKLLSVFFHPIVLPTLFCLILFNAESYLDLMPIQTKFVITLVVFFTTFVLPSASMPVLKSFSLIKTYEMEEKSERLLPMFITAVSFSICFSILAKMPVPVPGILFRSLIGACVSLLLGLIITSKWKISAHTLGMGGCAATIFGFGLRYGASVEIWLAGFFVVAGLIASVRIYLGAHTFGQVLAGFFLGFFILLACILFI